MENIKRYQHTGKYKRIWGTLTVICPVCESVREVTKNSLYITRLPKDKFGRTIRKCRSCARRHDYASWFEGPYRKDLSANRRKQQRVWGINYLGGKCKECQLKYDGTNGWAFDFHHRNPAEKEFSLSLRRYSWDRLKNEVDKCDLLCGLCHRKEHSEPY